MRIFRAGSAVGDLIDAVLVPSAEHDRDLEEVLARSKRRQGDEDPSGQAGTSLAEILRQILPREGQLGYVRSLHDADLATT